MKTLDPPYALWSIWHQLSALQHWLVYTLILLSLYAGFCVVSTILGLYAITHQDMDGLVVDRIVAALRVRCTNLHYAIIAESCLFGIVLFTAFQFVAQFIMSNDAMGAVIGNFVLDSAFAANVFAVLLILHLAQWFASNRLSSYSERLRRKQ